jgi:hypothetical protein
MIPTACLRWLVRDTLRQALSSGVCWLMLGTTALCVLGCLTARFHPGQGGGTGPVTRVEALFGLVGADFPADRPGAVRAVQALLASGVADTLGLLLALLWTAGFLPAFLDPASVIVLLVKPVPRWLLLLGKCLGVLVFLGAQALLFVAGTWLALGLATGAWDARYFLCLPLLLLNFTVYFSFSAMLAVTTRHTVACVFGSVAFWCLSWAANFARHALLALGEQSQLPALGGGAAVEGAYWLLPRPLDAHLVLLEALGTGGSLGRLVDLDLLIRQGAWHPVLSLACSAAVATVLLAVAAYEFLTADY